MSKPKDRLVGYCAGCGKGVCARGQLGDVYGYVWEGKLVYHDACFLALPRPETRPPKGKRERKFDVQAFEADETELRSLMALTNGVPGARIVR